ncbi:MAG TPA: NADP-dependent oxidoreductase [Phenylobacterium sp.]|nr:NADP-dependent oxidoreductase [Phenylobacterium sp.]
MRALPPIGQMRALRLHAYGAPAEVLRLEAAPIPDPGRGQIRIRVAACGLNPADWALCQGLFARDLPRGVGLDLAGVVDAVGEGVTGVRLGDAVLGPANYLDCGSAGAADFALMDHWAAAPTGLDMVHAASLTMAVETAYRHIDWLGVAAGQTILVNGGGTVIGFAAVQMALMRGAHVIATAGETFAERLRALGATVTAYGDGMVERVREIAGGGPDLVFDTAPLNMRPDLGPPGGVLGDLVAIAGGDARRVMTCGDFMHAGALGVRTGAGEAPGGPGGAMLRYDVLSQFAELAASRRFSIPVARTFALADWREALDISLRGRAHGKLVLTMEAG